MRYNKLLILLVLFLFFSICIYAQSSNTPPIANAGADTNVEVGEEVELQGSGSGSDSLAFTWAIVFKPVGSKAQLSNNNIPNPTFIADVEGKYMFNLRVNDDQSKSLPDTVLYTTQSTLLENKEAIISDEEERNSRIIDESPRGCTEGNCKLDTKQWCDDGVFVSNEYCEHCKDKDDACLNTIGGFCSDDSDCEASLICVSFTCVEPKPVVRETAKKKDIEEITPEPIEESDGISGTLFLIIFLIMVFGAGSYGFYYYKDYFIKPKQKKSNVLGAVIRYIPVLQTPEEKKKIKQIVKKRRKVKKEERENFFETFYKKEEPKIKK